MARPYIMVAPLGARRSKLDHPALPITLPEIVQTARACCTEGADALHLHIRGAQGEHSLDAGHYREALSELARAVPQMRVQITTEAAGIFTVQDQLTCLETLRPAWASISIREIARDPSLAPRLYAACAEAGTQVQHIAYDASDLQLLGQWQSLGLVRKGQVDVLCVLGRYSAGQTSNPADLDQFLPHLPHSARWMACAFGPQEHACLTYAAQKGGALRVGFENSLTDEHGQPHASNAASVAALIHRMQRNAA